MTTHYSNLRVTQDAPIEVIKASYKALAQKYHPDRNPDPKAAQYMQIINAAWETLSDPQKRAKHDEAIARQGPRPGPSPRPSTARSGSMKFDERSQLILRVRDLEAEVKGWEQLYQHKVRSCEDEKQRLINHYLSERKGLLEQISVLKSRPTKTDLFFKFITAAPTFVIFGFFTLLIVSSCRGH